MISSKTVVDDIAEATKQDLNILAAKDDSNSKYEVRSATKIR